MNNKDYPIYTLNTPNVRVRMRVQGTDALFTFKRPNPLTIRQYFSNVRPRFRSSGDNELKMLPQERTHAAAMLVEHLTRVQRLPSLEDFPDSIEAIKEHLQQPLATQVLFDLVNNGLLGMTALEESEASTPNDNEAEVEAEDKFSFGSMFAARPIYLGVSEWDDEGIETPFYIRVRMKEPTALEQRRLENAQPFVRKKRGDLEHQEDVGLCQQLFRDRVQSIDQCQYYPMGNLDAEPLPCTRETVGEWMPFVPYQLVSNVLAEEQLKGKVGNG